MALSTTKRFNTRAFEQAGFWNEDGEPRLNIEGTVALATESLEANINVDSSSASYGGTYIGKDSSATNGDFDVAYTSAETVTFSNYPSGISGFHADDIELVRQIDTNGAVVESYTRDDATMSIAGDVLTVSGASFAATDTFVVLTNLQSTASGSSSGSSVGGGSSTYSNAQGDFTATITDATKNITIAGLPFTLEDIHVVGGSIKKITSAGVVSTVPLTTVTVSAGVITVSDADNFATGDSVLVYLVGPDKAYDEDVDANLVFQTNPNYEHYTSVEHLINESNLGIDGTHDGGDASTDFTDTGETYTAETVAEGYTIYNVTDGSDAIIDADSLSGLAGDGGAGNPTADDIEHAALANGTDDDWDDADVASIPECKRFVIPSEGYNFMSVDVLLDSQDANNSCYCKIYATNDDTADDTDDTYWKDISQDVFGSVQLSADGIGGAARAVTQGIYFIDTATTVLKYMIKIIAECDNGTQNNEFDIRIKKSS